MKSNLVIQYQGNDVTYKVIEDQFKELWKGDGNRVKDIKDLNLYFKPEEKSCYYVVNDDIKGSFEVSE